MSNRVFTPVAGAGFGALALLATWPALAADLAYPPYHGAEPAPARIYREERVEEALPPPPPEAVYPGPRFVAQPRYAPLPDEACRTIIRRRVDFDGEEVVKRVRICEEEAYGRPPPRFGRPRPVPPADVPYGGWDGPPRW